MYVDGQESWCFVSDPHPAVTSQSLVSDKNGRINSNSTNKYHKPDASHVKTKHYRATVQPSQQFLFLWILPFLNFRRAKPFRLFIS